MSHSFLLKFRDGFFVKDARGWDSNALGRGYGLDWPPPTTIAGALRTAWGRMLEGSSDKILGPNEWLQLRDEVSLGASLALRRSVRDESPWQPSQRIWPTPNDAVYWPHKNNVHMLQLETKSGLLLDGGAMKSLRWPAIPFSEKADPTPRWWGDRTFVRWLCGIPSTIETAPNSLKLDVRVEPHVGINSQTQAGEEGILYVSELVEPLNALGYEWAIGLNANLPAEPTGSLHMTLGSERRKCFVDSLVGSAFDFPGELETAVGDGVSGIRLIVVTPTFFSSGWLPDFLGDDGSQFTGSLAGIDVVLRGAVLPRYASHSGWDIANGQPKPTQRWVRPGSVYYFKKSNGERFSPDELKDLWLTAVGQNCEDGLGVCVAGIWNLE